jgi:hypothetical protein
MNCREGKEMPLTSLLEPVIKELTTAISRLTDVLENKRSEEAPELSPPIKKLSNPIIPSEAPKVTDKQVLDLLKAKRTEGKMEPLRKLMQTKYGATKFSELDKETYAEFLRDAEDL